MKKVPILLSISTRRARLAVGRAAPGGRFIVYAASGNEEWKPMI